MIKADINREILRQKIIKLALLQYKKPYEHGKHGPDTFDCAGFVWYVYNQVCNIDIYGDADGKSTTTRIMRNNCGKTIKFDEYSENKDISQINIGDILFFHRQDKNETEPKPDNKYPGHCGIYLGDNNFIHCTRTKELVLINNFKSKYWTRKLVGSKDIISNIRR